MQPTRYWLTADWHLGEDRFEIMGRPFSNVQEHIDHLVTCHNKVVLADDLVYVVGDTVYSKTGTTYLPQIGRFNGRKILIRGNHDNAINDEQFAFHFERIVPDGGGIELEIEGIPCYLTHYPTRGREDRFNLVGHVHHTWHHQLNSLNVGVDVNHFYPTNFTSVPKHLAAITKFYDEDVWVAYQTLNNQYRGTRGKTGSYFSPPTDK